MLRSAHSVEHCAEEGWVSCRKYAERVFISLSRPQLLVCVCVQSTEGRESQAPVA